MAISRREMLCMAPFVLTRGRAATPKPNIVLFMTDDHGAWALGSYGCKEMHTPNLDRLATEGARFTRAFACTPVCSPSRMTYMTGKIPSHHGVQDWLRPVDSFGQKSRRFLDGHETFAGVLNRNGYTLGLTGKWHMGEDDKAHPGYSYWATVPGGGGTYKNPDFVRNGVRQKINPFKTDGVIDCALDFLGRQKKGNPFLLQVPFYAPHTPYDLQPEQDRKPYQDAAFSCYPDTPMHPWQNQGLKRHFRDRESKLSYSALITAVDRNVGRVLRKLEDMGERENTVVIFTADQGWNAGHHGVWGKGNGTVPFNMYDESIRVPLIWNQPGRIKPGQTPDAMVSSYDFFPSILDYAGLKAGADPARAGESYAPVLQGKRMRRQNRLYFEYGYVRAVRTENLKYVERTDEWPRELYDLEADAGETRNLIDDPKYAKQLGSLRADLHSWFRKTGAPPLPDWRSTVKQQELTVYSR